MSETVPPEGGIVAPHEALHLRAIFRRTRGQPGVWIDSSFTSDKPPPTGVQGLVDRGFAKTTVRRSGPLRIRDLGWSMCLTEQGVVVAKLLGFSHD